MQGIAAIPESPQKNSNDNVSEHNVHPASFRYKQPTTISPSASSGKMYQDVSNKLFYFLYVNITFEKRI